MIVGTFDAKIMMLSDETMFVPLVVTNVTGPSLTLEEL